jgi:hypothetical protein
LQVSGLTLMGVMTVMYFTRSTRSFARVSLWIGLAIAFVSPFVYQVDWFAIVPEPFAGYLSYKHGSLFGLFPFSAYMFFGVSVGAWLQSVPAAERAQRFPRVAGAVGLGLVALGLVGTYMPLSFLPFSSFFTSFYGPHDYYLASPHFVMIRMGCTLLLMSALTFVYRYTQAFEQYYSRLGKKSLYIYTAHLILLFGTPWFGGITRTWYRVVDVPTGIVAAFAVIALTLVSAYWLDHYQRHSTVVRRGIRLSLGVALLYALIV